MISGRSDGRPTDIPAIISEGAVKPNLFFLFSSLPIFSMAFLGRATGHVGGIYFCREMIELREKRAFGALDNGFPKWACKVEYVFEPWRWEMLVYRPLATHYLERLRRLSASAGA